MQRAVSWVGSCNENLASLHSDLPALAASGTASGAATAHMGRLVVVLAVAAAGASRANICFTAHGKTSLQCTQPLTNGPIAVYDDTETPQKARTFHHRNGRLCEKAACKRCMAPGGAWVACSGSTKLPIHVMGANADWERAKAVGWRTVE